MRTETLQRRREIDYVITSTWIRKARDVKCRRPADSNHSRCRYDRPKHLGLKKWNRLLRFVKQVLSVEDSIFPGCGAVLFRHSRRFNRTKILPECRKLQSVHRVPVLARDMLSVFCPPFCAQIVIFAPVLMGIFLCWQLGLPSILRTNCNFCPRSYGHLLMLTVGST
jgi:hypothetical protein